jgi:aerotaxis receptor
MRSNLPVTQHEYAFPSGLTLVSVTDLKGRITYCNPAFIKLSGFERDELLGQAHNLVRHPDMPEEAFRDMWTTIQSGLPWSGVVKNRRKSGDHYWVQANATPMLDGDQITGYLSVRSEPTRAAIEAADKLYALMREEAQHGRLVHVLRQGQVMRNDLAGRIVRLLTLGTSGKLMLVQLLAVCAIAALAMLGLPGAFYVPMTLGVAAAGYWATRQLAVKPLQRLVVGANPLASGDLSYEVATDATGMAGQLQQALKQMSLNLRTVVHDVRSEVVNLTTGISEIAAGNDDLSARTESQAGSLEQTAASMEEITTRVGQSATVATHGAELAHEAEGVTKEGSEAVNAVADTMRNITDSSKKIGEMNLLIEAVAFQTNILALNAAVEAAHAGEQGRGFAVVAAEVRALATRTAEAAKSIRALVGEADSRVAQGNVCTDDAKAHLHGAIDSVRQVSTALDEISASAVEEKLSISQINEAVVHMDSLTQQNSALVEQIAAAAHSLQLQSEGVNNSMRLFRLQKGEVTLSQLDTVDMRRNAKLLSSAAS